MSLNDPLANVLSALQNAGDRGVQELETKNNSTLIRGVLELMQKLGYIKGIEVQKDVKGDSLKILLSGSINKTGVIKPRYQISKDNFERFEKRFLPAKGFGVLIISTNQGILTHEEAKEKGIGGSLISFVY